MKGWGDMRKPALEDILTIAGVILIAYGAWLVYAPAGFMVLGVQLICLSFLMLASRARSPAKAPES